MNPNRFDQITRSFSERRLSRRTAVTEGVALAATGAALAGLGSAAAQEATPIGTPESFPHSVTLPTDGDAVTHLFVQSFQSGSIAPATGEFGTHTVTLEQGMGQTIVFGDRPSREVGVAPTPAFLDGLGFNPDNPPNAALLVEAEPGVTDIAVVELFNPTYDEATHTATYDIAVLANWQNDLEMGFQEAPLDLSDLTDLGDEFGRTHLIIDGCDYRSVGCHLPSADPYKYGEQVGLFTGQATCFWFSTFGCQLCTPKDAQSVEDIQRYWSRMCNENFPACNNQCVINP